MNNGVQIWVKCDACHHGQFTSLTACSRCGQEFSKSALEKPVLPKEPTGRFPPTPEKENPIKKEISCYRCRSLWIGVAIAGLALTIILNTMYGLFDFALYQTYDIIRYISSFIVIGFFSILVWVLLDDFCKGNDGKVGLVDKGSKWGLTCALGLAVAVIVLLVVTFVALDISIFFYSNYAEYDYRIYDMTDADYNTIKERFLASDCRYVKDLVDQGYSDRLEVEYFDMTIKGIGNTMTDGLYNDLSEKYKGCWKR